MNFKTSNRGIRKRRFGFKERLATAINVKTSDFQAGKHLRNSRYNPNQAGDLYLRYKAVNCKVYKT